MGYRYDEFAPGEVYHLFTRSVEQRDIFLDTADHQRFIALLTHCLPQGSIRSFSIAQRIGQPATITSRGSGLVDLLCYCLMSNHIHLLVQENSEGGTSLYMQRLLTSYSKYFNKRYGRSGSLFINPFKGVLVGQDEQLLQVSRYIHLNPYVAHMTEDPLVYPWSSLGEYLAQPQQLTYRCHGQLITSMLPLENHQRFIQDEADYARSLADIKHQLID